MSAVGDEFDQVDDDDTGASRIEKRRAANTAVGDHPGAKVVSRVEDSKSVNADYLTDAKANWYRERGPRPPSLGEVEIARKSGDMSAAWQLLEALDVEIDATSSDFHPAAIMRAKLLRHDGRLGDLDVFLKQHLARYAESIPRRQKIDIECTLAENARIRGATDSAWDRHLRILRESVEIEDARLWLWAVTGLGRISSVRSQPELALGLFRRGTDGARALNDDRNLAWCLRGMADAILDLPESDAALAEDLCTYAIALFRQAKYKVGLHWAEQSLGDAFVAQGRDQEALSLYGQSIESFNGLDARGEAFGRARWGLLAMRMPSVPESDARASVDAARIFFESNRVTTGLALIDNA